MRYSIQTDLVIETGLQEELLTKGMPPDAEEISRVPMELVTAWRGPATTGTLHDL
jgi:hypothetical protein